MSKRSRLNDISGHFLEVGVKDEIGDDLRDDDRDPDFVVEIEEPTNYNGSTSKNGCCINLWTPEATSCLITLYKKYIDDVGRPPMRSMKEMFEKISLDLRVLGHDYATHKVENKWRVLERKYKRHEAMMDKRAGRIPTKLRRSMYFEHKEELDDIFGPIARNSIVQSTGIDAETMDNVDKLTQTEDDGSLGNQSDDMIHAKMIEKVVDRLGTYFIQMEKNNERRHREITAIRLNELEIQTQMLEVKKAELELRKRQMNFSEKDGVKRTDESILS